MGSFPPTLPPFREREMRNNGSPARYRRGRYSHPWQEVRGSSCLDGLAHPRFLTPKQGSNDSQCVQLPPHFREFQFFMYEHFVYGFHSDREPAQLYGELAVQVIRRL
jgi:hypothetical protein